MVAKRRDGTFLPVKPRPAQSVAAIKERLNMDRATRFVRRSPEVDQDRVPSLPPGNGRFAINPVWTFQGRVSSLARVYLNPDEAFKHSRQNAIYMRNDCAVMECVEARQRAVSLLNWHVEPEDGKDSEQVEAAKKLTNLLQATPYFTKYRFAMQNAIWFGRYALQNKWGWRFRKGQREAIIEDWKPVNGDKLAFTYDDGSHQYREGDVGIRLSTVTQEGLSAEQQKQIRMTDWGNAYFLEPSEQPLLSVHRHIVEDGAFDDPLSAGSIYGVGIRSRIYWTWFQMAESLGMLMEFLERFGLGITIYWYPWGNNAARDRMAEQAKKQHPYNNILLPRMQGDPSLDAFGIDRIEPNPQGAQMLQDLIVNLFGHRIKRYILGQTLTTESEGAGLGSSGISDLHKWSFFQIVKDDAINLEETITRTTLAYLIRYNMPWAADWGLRFKIDTEHPNTQQQLEAAERAYNMGLEIKASDLRDLVGFGKPESGDEVLSLAATQPMPGEAALGTGQQNAGGPAIVSDAIRKALSGSSNTLAM